MVVIMTAKSRSAMATRRRTTVLPVGLRRKVTRGNLIEILGGRLSLWSRSRQPPRRDRAVSPRGPCRLAHPLLHREPSDAASGGNQCSRAPNARSSRGAAMMAMLESGRNSKLVLLTAVLALAFSVMGCAATGTSPLSSHGVDYIPAFDTPYAGNG
jgi:hypothetical protein